MSSGERRLPVMPSRMWVLLLLLLRGCANARLLRRRVLQSIKERSNAARKGWDLLKRKSDAIKMNLNNKLKEILVVSGCAFG